MRAPGPSSTLANLEVFCRTYELGSFSRAAASLSVTPQAVSRAVGRLEASLGVTLFRRNTRSLRATDEGRAYYEGARRALAIVAEAETALRERKRAPSGLVRISMPTTYGHHRLLPALARFRAEYPDVSVEANVSNRNVDFVAEGYDLAVRMGELDDASLVARKLGDFSVGVFASPAYLKKEGTPRTVAELSRHRLIAFVHPRTGRVLPWIFAGGVEVLPSEQYRCSDDALGCITLARAGGGLVHTYHFLVERETARGELVEVLSEHVGRSRRFSLLYPKSVVPSRAVRALIDFVVADASAAAKRR